ncbi:MAG TPA: LPS export ABC transporter periplasmic protein LptC [Steroidobacteraceae bacterium]|nr:LPS export ABC transporter periplasmic protein LptC [Steroidobacteraceae bacterium]
MIYRLLAIMAVVALVVGLIVLSGGTREVAAPSAAGAPAHDPGYAALGARLVQTAGDGQPLYTVDAARISQQPDGSTVQMTQVQMGFRAASGAQWTARADRGELGQDTGVVQLDGNVRLAGLLPGTQDRAEISTEHLSFDTREQVASTPEPVTLSMSGRELQARGLVARLKEGRVQLESTVHGSYLP